jgi:hypothetical protein
MQEIDRFGRFPCARDDQGLITDGEIAFEDELNRIERGRDFVRE